MSCDQLLTVLRHCGYHADFISFSLNSDFWQPINSTNPLHNPLKNVNSVSCLSRADHVSLRCSGQYWQPLRHGAAQSEGTYISFSMNWSWTLQIFQISDARDKCIELILFFRYTSMNLRTSKAVGWICLERAVICVRRVSTESAPLRWSVARKSAHLPSI